MCTLAMTPRWFVPAETAAVESLWMAFPHAGAMNLSSLWQLSAVRRAFARVAEAAAEHTPVLLAVDPTDIQVASTYVDTRIPRLEVPLNNSLIGRTGPTSALSVAPFNPQSRRPRHELRLIDWAFNGFGRRPGVGYGLDDVAVGTLFENLYGNNRHVSRYLSAMVAEGGSWVTDGAATAIASKEVLLDPARNPGWSEASVHRELRRSAGIEKIIWLPQGLTRSTHVQQWGGHIDQLVNFVAPGMVLLHWQEDPTHPDYEVCEAAERLLAEATDAEGKRLAVVRVPAPHTHTDARGPVNWSYLDYRILNDVILVPRFIDPGDEPAYELLGQIFPGRQIVPVLVSELYDQGFTLRSIALPITSTRMAY